MKIGAIIQARTSSTRLPGKVLMEMPSGSGITVVQQIIRRLKKSKKLNQIIVATSTEKGDDAVAQVAGKENVTVFRGSLNNVLERYYFAATENALDIIVRITADCPCVDAAIVDLIVERHLAEKADFTSNVSKRTFADGLDVEVFNYNVLKKMNEVSEDNTEREHVTLYVYRNSEQFKMAVVEAVGNFHAPGRRITLDTPEDYALLCAIYDALYFKDEYFNAGMVMDLFGNKAWLRLINA